jgi:hypothetical protein
VDGVPTIAWIGFDNFTPIAPQKPKSADAF